MISFAAQNVPDAFRARTLLRAWLLRVAKREGHSIEQLNYVLMTDNELLRYNRHYLGHNEYTDIITFDTSEGRKGAVISGDILISYDRVKENARAFDVPAQQELKRVMVHGLLHLCGHGDKGEKQQRAMRALEDKYLALR
ncbi:MAG: rRNA maturation RNase YbeY [Flavobacteriales bacterium]|nr:rRNA maturation RNase YbeY [Flavobacteriales bacterium]MBK7554710.1 rRNA maturation RNase YbeY [Flavobacteriales bacterium]